jgi:hypothetical protein
LTRAGPSGLIYLLLFSTPCFYNLKKIFLLAVVPLGCQSLVFLKSIFFGSEKFQVSAHVLPK